MGAVRRHDPELVAPAFGRTLPAIRARHHRRARFEVAGPELAFGQADLLHRLERVLERQRAEAVGLHADAHLVGREHGVGPGQGGGAAGEGELAELAAGKRPGLSGHGCESLQRLKRAAAAGRQRTIRAGRTPAFPACGRASAGPMVSVPASGYSRVGRSCWRAAGGACHTRRLGDFRDTAPIPATERRPLDYTFHPDPSPSAPPPFPRAPRLGIGRFLDDFRALGRTGQRVHRPGHRAARLRDARLPRRT